ncbi:hypothetical protein THI4931_50810 [Pandoraea sputorum]|nr:hypothetical protein THI4931_50810 [Pandoraea sputorum]
MRDMVTIAPPATANIATDRLASFRANIALTVGTCTPHVAYRNPLQNSNAIVAARAGQKPVRGFAISEVMGIEEVREFRGDKAENTAWSS